MPLLPSARNKIRVNLQKISTGKKPKAVLIGHLTPEQLLGVNEFLKARGFSPVSNEVMFKGEHAHESRMVRDGYSIDDVIDQITNGMDAKSVPFESETMSAIRNETPRVDRFGNQVIDTIVFRCAGKSKPELYSVIPRGDVCPNKMAKTKEATPVDDLLKA